MKNKHLLFYFSDEKCAASPAVVPTLAALADGLGIDFETYICSRPLSWGGKTLPFTGHMHGESFYYLANFYEKIYFVSLSDFKSFQFRREILGWGGDVVSCRRGNEVLKFYNEVFTFFNKPLPDTVAVVPDPPADTSHLVEGEAFLSPYFYYDIFKGGLLGMTASLYRESAEALAGTGIKKVMAFACRVETGMPPVEYPYGSTSGTDYGDITGKIAEKWSGQASGIAYGDGNTMSRWTAYFLRENLIPLYQPFRWEEFVPVIADYSKKIGNPMIVGCQNVYPHNTDAVMAEFSKYGMFFDLIGVDPRHGFSIQKKHKLPLDWLADADAPWENEYSDAWLQEKIDAQAIPVCFLLYAADLGHLPTLPRILDLMSQDGNRAGIAFPSTWYDYHPELLEQLYIPLEQGGVFPQLEPMISSGGDVVISESEGMIEPEILTARLLKAKADIAAAIGEKLVPRGYYPWQDASPFYRSNTGTPQFDAVATAGFEYYISYRNSRMSPEILYNSKGMLAFNQPQVGQWLPGEGDSEVLIRKYEAEKPQWIILPYDMPFFGLSPVYLNGEALHERFKGRIMGMQTIAKTMKYVRSGGDSSKLFMLKPHELSRYIKLLKKSGIIPDCSNSTGKE